MKYNKLVRDKIPQIMARKGEKAIIHIASENEYWEKLKGKLKEEVEEYFQSEDKEEIADILEVILAISDFKKLDMKELEKLRRKKASERGSFKKRIILDEVN